MLEQPAAGCGSFIDERKTEMAIYMRTRTESAISVLRVMSHVVLLTHAAEPPAAASVMEEGLRRLSRPSAGPCSTEASVGKADKSGTEKW